MYSFFLTDICKLKSVHTCYKNKNYRQSQSWKEKDFLLVILELDLNYVKISEFVVKSRICTEKCTNLKCTA